MGVNYRQVARRLQELPDLLQITEAQLCKGIDVSRSQWSNYKSYGKKGFRKIPPEIADRIKQRYAVTTDYIYTGDPSALPSALLARIPAAA